MVFTGVVRQRYIVEWTGSLLNGSRHDKFLLPGTSSITLQLLGLNKFTRSDPVNALPTDLLMVSCQLLLVYQQAVGWLEVVVVVVVTLPTSIYCLTPTNLNFSSMIR